MTKSTVRRLADAPAVIAITIVLSGCGQQPSNSQMTPAALPELPATLPLASGPESLWPFAPAVSALSASAPLRTVRVANPDNYYGYADAAYDFQDVLGDAPPDYYFDYARPAGRRQDNVRSHLPLRRRERAMLRFRRMKSLQKFASVHANVHNQFNLERHLVDRQTLKQRRSAALAEWRQLAS